MAKQTKKWKDGVEKAANRKVSFGGETLNTPLVTRLSFFAKNLI